MNSSTDMESSWTRTVGGLAGDNMFSCLDDYSSNSVKDFNERHKNITYIIFSIIYLWTILFTAEALLVQIGFRTPKTSL